MVSKRKDAVFCKDSACRKKAHQARREQGANLPPAVSSNKAAVVVTFPDGSRWLLELSPLQVTDPVQLPSLKQVPAPNVENSSGSALAPIAIPMSANGGTSAAINTPEIGSEQISQAMIAPVPASPENPPDSSPSVSVNLTPESARPKELRTLELFFTDHAGRLLLFRDAVLSRFGGGWSVKNFARAQLGMGRREGCGLGGIPGRWRDFYPHQSPTEFGLDADLAVLYADDDENKNRTYVADPELLRQALGADWRALLRTRAEGSGLERR